MGRRGRSASRNVPTATVSDDEIRALLDRYGCPVAFHEVRTRFLGMIASPIASNSPVETVKALWGGELPEFDSFDDVNELLGALVMGLWNRLTRHQERRAPFRLLRTEVPTTREALGRMAQIRRQELDGFVEGLFGGEVSIDLPERANRGLNVLAELRAMLEGVRSVAMDETKPASTDDITVTIRQIRELTKIAEQEMHAVVLSCTRARRQLMPVMPGSSQPCAEAEVHVRRSGQ